MLDLNRRQDQVAKLSQLFASARDFLLYGCDLAADEQDLTFLQELGRITQTDVAANTGATGHGSAMPDQALSPGIDADVAAQEEVESDGPDWTLDYRSGTVRTALALSEAIQNDWQGIFSTFTVTNTNDSGVGSLRAAINSANNTGGTDAINFNISGSADIFLNNILVISSEGSTDASAQRGSAVSAENKNNNGTARSNAATSFAIADRGPTTPEENSTLSGRSATSATGASRSGLYDATRGLVGGARPGTGDIPDHGHTRLATDGHVTRRPETQSQL